MSGIMKSDRSGACSSDDPLPTRIKGEFQWTKPPGSDGHLNGTMGKEWVMRQIQFFLLPSHDIDRIVQHHLGDARRSFGHENWHSGLTCLKKRETADMVLVSVCEDGGLNRVVGDFLKHRCRRHSRMLGMHATIQH